MDGSCGPDPEKSLFNPKPWLSYSGTCFTTHYFWNVTRSGGLASKDIKLNTSPDYTADFSPLLGQRFAFSGINLVLHTNDHPIAAMDSRGFSLESGTNNRLVLSAVDVGTNFVNIDIYLTFEQFCRLI